MSIESFTRDYDEHRGIKDIRWIAKYPKDIDVALDKLIARGPVGKAMYVTLCAFLSGLDKVPVSTSRLNYMLERHDEPPITPKLKTMTIASLGHFGEIDKTSGRTKAWLFICTDPELIGFRKRLDKGERGL